MLRRIPGVHHEAVAEATAEAGGEATETAEVEAVEGAEEHVEESRVEETAAAEPDYGQMLQSEAGQQALQQAIAHALAEQNAGQEQEAAPDPLADFDFLADDAPQRLAQVLKDRDRELLAAIQGSPTFQHAEEQSQTQWVGDQFTRIEADLKTQLPESVRQLAVTMAAGSRPPEWHPSAARFDPAQALQTAAREIHTLMKTEREAAVKAYLDGVNENNGGGHEPSGTGAAAIRTESVAETPSEVTERWLARQNLA